MIAFIALAIQAARPMPAPVQPILSVGSAPELSQAAEKVGRLSQGKDFAGAKAALRLLPSPNVKVEWDDASLPASSKYDFGQQRDAVMLEWSRATRVARYTVVPSGGDVRATFFDGKGVTVVWSDDPKQPRLTVKIGLKEGDGAVDPALVHNGFSYALGSYFGIAKLPMPGFVMSGFDGATDNVPPRSLEAGIATDNLTACGQIRDLVTASTPVSIGAPKLGDDPAPIDLGGVTQGDPVNFKFSVRNVGDGRLAYRIVPDCSCFARTGTKVVEPGAASDAIDQMTTMEFTGTLQGGILHHTLYLMTNDSTNPNRSIPLQIKITPRYRFIPNRQVVVAQDDSVTFDAYLFFPPEKPLAVLGAISSGLPGDVSVAKWEGVMADPDLNEGPLPRKGYKFTLKLKNIPGGSQFGTNIDVATDDQRFPQLLCTVFVQKGILAVPASVFMGEVGAAPRKLSFLVTRRGKAFNILGVETDTKHLKATYAPTDIAGEYRITVSFDGQSPAGDFHGSVIVKTDDPTQKEMVVPILGSIRQ